MQKLHLKSSCRQRDGEQRGGGGGPPRGTRGSSACMRVRKPMLPAERFPGFTPSQSLGGSKTGRVVGPGM